MSERRLHLAQASDKLREIQSLVPKDSDVFRDCQTLLNQQVEAEQEREKQRLERKITEAAIAKDLRVIEAFDRLCREHMDPATYTIQNKMTRDLKDEVQAVIAKLEAERGLL